MEDFFWGYDENDKPLRISYAELDKDVVKRLLIPKPIGGFCWAADDFARLPLPSVPFYIKGWLPKQGRLEIYGEDKAGKSFLAMQLARCIGSGLPFLGIETEAARVLYLQFELGEQILQGRMKSTGYEYPNVYVGTSFSLKVDRKDGREQVIRAMDDIEPQVLILDPLYKILEGDENDARDVLQAIDFLDSLINIYNCSLVIMHHPGKDISKGGRGSSVLSGWHDTVVEFRKLKQIVEAGEPRHLKLTPRLMRHAELPIEGIEIALGSDFEFHQVDAQPTSLEKLEAHFKKNKGQTVRLGELEMAKLGSRKTIYDNLGVLMRRGQVEKPSRGEYVLKEGG